MVSGLNKKGNVRKGVIPNYKSNIAYQDDNGNILRRGVIIARSNPENRREGSTGSNFTPRSREARNVEV